VAAHDQCEIIFNRLGNVTVSTSFLLVLSTELIRWTQAASGAAGRANVEHCPASSFLLYSGPLLADFVGCIGMVI